MVGGEKQIISGAGTRHTGIFSLKGEQFWVISLSFRYLKNTFRGIVRPAIPSEIQSTHSAHSDFLG